MSLLWWLIAIGLTNLCSSFELNSCSQIRAMINETECRCDESDAYFNLTCPINKKDNVEILFVENTYEIDCKSQTIDNINLVPQLVKGYINFVEYFGFIDCSMSEFVNLTNKLIQTSHVKTMALKKITHMLPEVLEGYHVNSLHILESPLVTLPEDLLYGLKELDEIFINNNNITTLPEEFFKNSRKLRGVNLGQNNLMHIPTKLFTDMPNLEYLHLFGNKISTINSSLFLGLYNLTEIELMTNQIVNLTEDAFIHLPRLKNLSLRSNQFRTFPVNLFRNNKELRTLKFNNNAFLTSLPDGFLTNLTKIEAVYLSYCNLSVIPENAFWGTITLSKLYLDYNNLKHLRRELFRDTINLRELHLEHNALEILDDGIFNNVKNLKELHLSYNKLQILDNTFAGLKNLEILYLQHNSLHILEKTSFKHFKDLTLLDMSYNNLTLEIPQFQGESSSILPHLHKLEKLYLQHNEIPYVYSDWVVTYSNLQELNLENNNISSLGYTELQFLQNHQVTVNLKHNKIRTIDLSTIELLVGANEDNIPKAKRIILLDGNPINCDCGIYDLVRYIDGSMHKDVRDIIQLHLDNVKCQTSNKYIGIPLIALRSDTLTCVLDEGQKLPFMCKENVMEHYQYRQHDKRLIMDCSLKGLTEIPHIEFNNTSKYKSLEIEVLLSGNNIKTLSKPVGNYDNVIELDLSHNDINSVLWIPPKIQVLKLHNNNLTYLSSKELSYINKTSLRNLTFHNNPWQCNCNLANFTKYLQENFKKVSNLREITCDEDIRRELTLLSLDDLCPNIQQVVIVICGLLAFFGLLVAVSAAFYFRFNQQIKVWLYARNFCLYFITEDELDQDKIYDAFISFSHEDEDFVVNELLPGLETGPHAFRLCVHFRDWQPGEFIATNIARSIDESRRTVVVLSRGFIRSEWGRMEFRTAHTEAMREGRARVIVIVYGDIGPVSDLDEELRAYLSTNTYIKWGSPWFWDNVRYALPHLPNLLRKQPTSLQHFDSMDLIKDPPTPPATATPPADSVRHDPLIHSALNVTLIDGTLVNTSPKKQQLNNNHLSGIV